MARDQGSIGKLIERLTIEHSAPSPIAVTSITRASTTATVTTEEPHGYASGDYVRPTGAVPDGYNAGSKGVKATVTGPNALTYQVPNVLATPATGSITVIYVSDPQGKPKAEWRTFAAQIPAEMIPVSADERLAAAAIPALATVTQYRFRIAVRVDLTDEMRVRWTPRWPPQAPEHVLEIVGLLPEDDGRRYMTIEAVEAVE